MRIPIVLSSILLLASCDTRIAPSSRGNDIAAAVVHGGAFAFVNFELGAAPGTVCPAIACPLPCDQATTLDACDARPDCHPVFVDNRTCGCAALGCCAKFSRCAAGATALCKAPPIACDALTPYCEGPYVVSYTNACYEGCVRSSDCALN